MAMVYSQYNFIYAVPNGGLRNVKVASKLKAEGVLAGVSDLVVPFPSKGFNGAYIEVKTLKGKPSEKQTTFINEMKARGYYATFVYGVRDAIDTIDEYLGVK